MMQFILNSIISCEIKKDNELVENEVFLYEKIIYSWKWSKKSTQTSLTRNKTDQALKLSAIE